MAMMTLASSDETIRGYEMAIDNASQVNIVHSRFLTNLRKKRTAYRGVDGRSAPKSGCSVGDLDGFYECIADDNVRISILSQHDVEQLYKVTYLQGISMTVHMPDRDVVFKKKKKLYVADFSDWVGRENIRSA